MKPRGIFYRGIVFVMLLIGAGAVIFAYRASAAAVYIVRGPTTAPCALTGQSAPATFQDNILTPLKKGSTLASHASVVQ